MRCFHILWGYEFGQKVWKVFQVYIEKAMQELQVSTIEIMFTTTWDLWNARNEMYWEAN